MSTLLRLQSLIARHGSVTAAAGRYSRTGLALGLASGCVSVPSAIKEDDSYTDHYRAFRAPVSNRDTSTIWRRAGNVDSSVSLLNVVPSVNEGEDGVSTPVSERMRNLSKRVRTAGIGLLDGLERRWQTNNGRVVLQVIGVNVAVFGLWKVLPTSIMLRHFSSSLEAMRSGRVWTTVTANFSHMNAFHLGVNMFLLDQFGRDVAKVITSERFVALYVAGGVAAVLASLASRRILRNNVLSLGASGSVMAVLFMFANLFPTRSVYIFGVYELPAKDAVILWALIDAAGVLGSFGKIDFAAHLGGGAFSFGYYNLIREDLSREHYERIRRKRSWFEHDQPNEDVTGPSQLRRYIDRLCKDS